MIAEFPEKLSVLFEPHRYKVLKGGRGGAKSWGIARALLILGAQKNLRILCARETMKSIVDSVHKLLCDQIAALGLQAYYTIEKARILGINGTEIFFAGLKHNINNIKSIEACDIVWVEEAQTVSKTSWQTLIPTIRKEGSEIWVSFNPGLDSDETWKRFVVSPPPGAAIVTINHTDNPWFPEVLKAEMEHMKETDPDSYQNVWEGHCRQVLDGAVYANELRALAASDRVTRVLYDATKPVHTFWDLGFGDATAIWFAQSFPFEFRLIDYLDGTQKPLSHYLTALQAKGYIYGTDYLPHDARAHQLGSGRSVEELMKAAGRKVQIVTKLSRNDGINAARSIFPQCYFDAEKTADGLQALRHYRYVSVEEGGTVKREPLHDWASNGADAFRYFGVSIKAPEREDPRRYEQEAPSGAWDG